MNGFLRQAAKFAAIGGGATLVHVLAAVTFNSLAQVAPLRANFLAFLVASHCLLSGQLVLDF